MSPKAVEEHRNVLLVDRASTRKTTVAKALGHAACARAPSVYYAPMAEVLQSLHAARADGTCRKVFRRVTGPDLVILDDAGFADLGREPANELFRGVCARHRQRSTIVVTSLPFKQWGEFPPSPAQAVAVADRLVYDGTILRFSGKPYRRPRDVHGAPLDGEELGTPSCSSRWSRTGPPADRRLRAGPPAGPPTAPAPRGEAERQPATAQALPSASSPGSKRRLPPRAVTPRPRLRVKPPRRPGTMALSKGLRIHHRNPRPWAAMKSLSSFVVRSLHTLGKSISLR